MQIPRVHLNGTSRNELVRQLQTGITNVQIAESALRESAPHERDYYPQEAGAFEQARREHHNRVTKLQMVRFELEAMLVAVEAQP